MGGGGAPDWEAMVRAFDPSRWSSAAAPSSSRSGATGTDDPAPTSGRPQQVAQAEFGALATGDPPREATPVVPDGPRPTLGFDGRTVMLRDKDGNITATYPATSGVAGVTDQRSPWKGPIPEGDYVVDPKEISEVHGAHAALRNLFEDWGNYRTALHPEPGTDTLGRRGFFLHGGDRPGSAGCIDVGHQDAVLFPELRKLDGPIRLHVEYPKQR